MFSSIPSLYLLDARGTHDCDNGKMSLGIAKHWSNTGKKTNELDIPKIKQIPHFIFFTIITLEALRIFSLTTLTLNNMQPNSLALSGSFDISN